MKNLSNIILATCISTLALGHSASAQEAAKPSSPETTEPAQKKKKFQPKKVYQSNTKYSEITGIADSPNTCVLRMKSLAKRDALADGLTLFESMHHIGKRMKLSHATLLSERTSKKDKKLTFYKVYFTNDPKSAIPAELKLKMDQRFKELHKESGYLVLANFSPEMLGIKKPQAKKLFTYKDKIVELTEISRTASTSTVKMKYFGEFAGHEEGGRMLNALHTIGTELKMSHVVMLSVKHNNAEKSNITKCYFTNDPAKAIPADLVKEMDKFSKEDYEKMGYIKLADYAPKTPQAPKK